MSQELAQRCSALVRLAARKTPMSSGLAAPRTPTSPIILETAVGRARVGCDAVGWQGATTLRAYAREEKQRGQRAAARLNRVRSALTQPVKMVVRKKANIHAVYPAEESGQLPFLGSWIRHCRN